jgi:hypothetical protein
VVAEWWKDKTGAGADMWQRLIVGYDAKGQADMLRVISPPTVLSQVLLYSGALVVPPVLGLAITGVYVWVRIRRVRRKVPVSAAGAACYTRLVRVLDRRGRLRRAAWQTPRELAIAASKALASLPTTASLAGLPEQVVDIFYRVRFGDVSPEPAEVLRINARLDELARALIRSGPLGSRSPA